MQTTIPLYGFGGGGGGAGATLTVTAPAGATVTVSKDGKTKTKTADSTGVAVFKGLSTGEWTVTITDGEQISAKTVTITTDYALLISFSVIPGFTYTGDFEIVNDADEPITSSLDNWKIRFLTSGTLTFTRLNGAEAGIDVFLVGGGSGSTYSGNSLAGGGAGGYTRTVKSVSVSEGTPISVVVGAGSAAGGKWSDKGDGPQDGGYSAFDIYQAAGGYGQTGHSNYTTGLSGGTGGQIYGKATAVPATDGADGSSSGKGQRSTPGPNGETGTTGEFGDESATIYSNGGCYGGTPRPNSGDAGRSAATQSTYGTDGAAGIVIIRNAREVA